MTYAEAVKRAETWHEVYNEECDNDPANGEAAYLDAQAMAVLRRAEPLIAAAENMIASVEGHHASQFEQRWMSKEEKTILRAALRFRGGK